MESKIFERQLDAVVTRVKQIPAESFTAYGGGWPREISTALLDAVFSMRATYRSKHPGVGVRGRLETFRTDHPSVTNELTELVALGEAEIRRVMGNAKTSQRLKSTAVIDAARRLVDTGVTTADDFRDMEIGNMKKVYTSVHGLGCETFEYLAMHLGIPGVKADTMIIRFVKRSLQEHGISPDRELDARALVVSAYEATGLGETLTHFDHAIWRFESDAAAAR